MKSWPICNTFGGLVRFLMRLKICIPPPTPASRSTSINHVYDPCNDEDKTIDIESFLRLIFQKMVREEASFVIKSFEKVCFTQLNLLCSRLNTSCCSATENMCLHPFYSFLQRKYGMLVNLIYVTRYLKNYISVNLSPGI